VDGQIYGGLVQGIGEALSEELIYNDSGELLTASYADFVMPTSVDAPDVVIKHFETPSPYTELGTKGMGESPIISAKAVIISAIEDALSPFGVRIPEAPATRERVRRWILNSQAR
jgi:CO/xanthine dehydrogenase Mo-binding subunit